MQADRAAQREELIERLEKVRGRRVGLGTWMLLASLPFIMMLQSALQELFAYNLPPAPDNNDQPMLSVDRIRWAIAWTAGSFAIGMAVFFGILFIRIRWGNPTIFMVEHHFHYFKRIEQHMEDFSPFEFASTWIPVTFFFPLIWLQVAITEINNYKHPQMDYDRTVTLFYGVAVFAGATLFVLFIVLILHPRLVHPRDHDQEQEILKQLDNLYRDSLGVARETQQQQQSVKVVVPRSSRDGTEPLASLLS